MLTYQEEYGIIVVGAGHAGCEAALASARMGQKTLLFTMNKETIAQMSCNPAVGGQAKGQLVKEIDALGGEIGFIADKTAIQIKTLNKKKGPAVWSTRTQNDRSAYRLAMRESLENQENLFIKQDGIVEVLVKEGKAYGVVTATGMAYFCKAVILTCGTFLNGLIHIGLEHFPAGRAGEFPALGLTESLIKLGFEPGRLKTGTPPRLDGRTIDFSKTIPHYGDEDPKPFSIRTKELPKRQKLCFLTYTNQKTHELILNNLDRSPLYSGKIKGVGPRYCPSIEDKVVKFREKPRHQLFLEPEGIGTNEYYVNGFATSLPEDVQFEALRTVPGLENAKMMRAGYAIEYDFFPPTQLKNSLETKLIENLFFAGQINGTSGYEEAAAQGIMAGINAVLKIRGEPPFVLDRSEAYIGVLIDDLITKGTNEPYRMFTSRAEYRLILREDNADQRLLKYGHGFGLISDEIYNEYLSMQEKIEKEKLRLRRVFASVSHFSDLLGEMENNRKMSLAKILKMPQIKYQDLVRVDWEAKEVPKEIYEQVELQLKYEGYIRRQKKEIEKFKKLESMKIPADFKYDNLKGFKREALEKLRRVNPISVGQASRISGVSPGDIAVLMVHLKHFMTKRVNGLNGSTD
ncbi:MAG: tRNA uridine-5-carboxymethylaminomethyl(34) synthesis enzyme MnmG [Candidatus Zixiibacteriota bacterium]